MARSISCTPADIAEGSKCLECLDLEQLKAAQVYFMELFIAGAGSTTPRTADELIALGKCYCDRTKFERYKTYLLWVLAELFYASTPTDIADVVEAIKCLKCSDKLPEAEIAVLCDLLSTVNGLQAPA